MHRSEARTWGRRLALSTALTAPVAAVYMTLMLRMDWDMWLQDHTRLINAMPWHWLVAWVLASAVQFHVGWTFYRFVKW